MMRAIAKNGRTCTRCCWIALICPIMFLAAIGDPGNARCLACWRTVNVPESEEAPVKPSEDEAEPLPATTYRNQRVPRRGSPCTTAFGPTHRLERWHTFESWFTPVTQPISVDASHFKRGGNRWPQLC